MINKTPTLLQARHALSRVAFSTRVALHFSVLFVLALFPCHTPSVGLLDLTESEAPLDQDESSEEAAVGVQARTHIRRRQAGFSLLVPVRGGLSLSTAGTANIPHSGHRLPNNLMAPLRC